MQTDQPGQVDINGTCNLEGSPNGYVLVPLLAACATAKSMFLEEKEVWLGGLDSNQDSQIQSLESYQLDDLPTGENYRK